MAQNPVHHATSETARFPPQRRVITAIAMVLVIAGFYILREHWGHVAGYWPYLLLAACPLIHLFGGHGSHNHGSSRDQNFTT